MFICLISYTGSFRIKDLVKHDDVSKNDAREIELCLLDGSDNAEHNGAVLVWIPRIFARHDRFFKEVAIIDRMSQNHTMTETINQNCGESIMEP